MVTWPLDLWQGSTLWQEHSLVLHGGWGAKRKEEDGARVPKSPFMGTPLRYKLCPMSPHLLKVPQTAKNARGGVQSLTQSLCKTHLQTCSSRASFLMDSVLFTGLLSTLRGCCAAPSGSSPRLPGDSLPIYKLRGNCPKHLLL